VGQVVRHRLFSYRGVVVGWDKRPTVDVANWEGLRDSVIGPEQVGQ
jgi:hemimethylated DNA binding protein